MSSVDSLPADETSAVAALYEQLLASWNGRDAATYAGLFAPDSTIVGFDGSQVDGPAAIAAHLGQIFADHPTPTYVAKIREVRALAKDVALLRAVAGLLPRRRSSIRPPTPSRACSPSAPVKSGASRCSRTLRHSSTAGPSSPTG